MRVGVRGSDLALAYANRACDELSCETEIVVIKTMGDLNPNVPIHEMGGKGVFCSAIETALINNEIDVAVHSLKDMPGDIQHPDLVIASYLKRNDPHDVLIGSVFEGCTIGTSSPRRREQIQELYGHLNVEIKTKIYLQFIGRPTCFRKLFNRDYCANAKIHAHEIVPLDSI